MSHRAGYVGIVGRPNTGKSTFLNRVLGQKVSIISHKAQTTRNRVVGIHSNEGVQAVLVDTPGHHEAWSKLNKALVREAEAALLEVDTVFLLVDLVPAVLAAQEARAIISKGEEVLLQRIQEHELPREAFEWYLDLRRFGSVPHAGFGMGIERFVAWMCGTEHVRETIPYPRMLYRLRP